MPKRLSVDRRQLAFPAGNSYISYMAAGQYYNGQPGDPGASTSSTAANTMRLFPFWVPQDMKFDRIGIEVTTAQASSNYRVGLYASDESGGPGALIVDSGNLDTSTTGGKEATIDIAVLGPALYWTAAVTDNGSVEVRATGYPSNAYFPTTGFSSLTDTDPDTVLNISHTFGALPDPAGSYSYGGGNFNANWVKLRVA